MLRKHIKIIFAFHLFSNLLGFCSSYIDYPYYARRNNPFPKMKKVEAKIQSEKKALYFQKSNLNNKQISGFDLSEQEMEKFKLWKDGVIPYYIDTVSYSDKALRDEIRSFLGIVNSVTSLNFQELPSPPLDENERWVFFVNRQGQLGCGDHPIQNFTTQGVQAVVLGYDCLNSKGELPDAVLAIAGVPPQHNAPNRDEYIKVYTENILPEKVELFNKLNDDDWLFHDLEYDFNSVSHYDSFKYSAQGKAVLEPLDNDHTVGEATDFTHLDILKLRMLYNYIARKKRLDLSECEKLFMVNSNFDTYKKSSPKIKPIRKPNKYLGLDENAVPDGDYQEFEDFYHDDKLKFEIQNNDGADNIDAADYTDNQIDSNQNEDSKSDGEAQLTTTENPDDQSENQKSKGPVNSLKLNRPSLDPLAAISDYDTDELERYSKKRKLKLNLKSKDPLALLSDYDTVDEYERKKRVNRIKGDTLKFAKQNNDRLNPKFI